MKSPVVSTLTTVCPEPFPVPVEVTPDIVTSSNIAFSPVTVRSSVKTTSFNTTLSPEIITWLFKVAPLPIIVTGLLISKVVVVLVKSTGK